MADDMFGDSALFDEFEKEREPSGSFVFYSRGDTGEEDKSRIYIEAEDSSASSDEDDETENVPSGNDAQQPSKSETENGNGKLDSAGEDSWSENDDQEAFISRERADKSTAFKLTYERNKFKHYCNIIDSTRYLHDEESPRVQILYQNNTFSRRHRTRIEGFVKYLMMEDMKSQSTMQKLDLKGSQPSCTDINDQLPATKRTDAMWQSHAILGCSQFYQDFMLDTLGWPLVEYNASLTDSWDIPSYEQMYKEALPVEVVAVPSGPAQRKKFTCWNCGGEHMLAECKEPRNQQKINEGRNAMMQAKQSQPQSLKSGASRYHEDAKMEPKYAQFKPGLISEELRSAMGLKNNQLPMYIYKMRALGYPPGWMQDAMDTKEHTLTVFGADGIELNKDGDVLEDGEMGVAEQPQPQGQLNVDKIVEYPGFSSLPATDTIDETEFYGMPSLQQHQLKVTLLAHTNTQKNQQEEESMKRKLEEEHVIAPKKSKLDESTDEMDLAADTSLTGHNISFHPPLPPDTPPGKPPLPKGTPPPTPESHTFQVPTSVPARSISRQSSSRSCDSPSLEDLEEQYQLLQKKLMEGDDSDVVVLDSISGEENDDSMVGDSDSLDSSIVDKSELNSDETEQGLPRVGSASSINTFGELGTGSAIGSSPSSPDAEVSISSSANTSLSKDYGTPILVRKKSVQILPESNRFAVGIEDHLPFENLPQSTGTFNKIRDVIGKIRDMVPSRKKKS